MKLFEKEPIDITVKSIPTKEEILSECAKYKKPKYFTTAKSQYQYNLSDSSLAPNTKTLLKIKQFDKHYIAQLESIIYNVSEKNFHELIDLLYLYREIGLNHYPIRITYERYPKLIERITYLLNHFFQKEELLLKSLYEMINSQVETQKEFSNG